MPHSGFQAVPFTRHGLKLRALLINAEPWFYARDIGRLIGQHIDERRLQKLDDDQYQTTKITCEGTTWDVLVLSESGVYALLVYHYAVENRSLRRWVTHDVIPALHAMFEPLDSNRPNLYMLDWPQMSISMLNWRGECWIRLKDMPVMLPTGVLRNHAQRPSLLRRTVDFLRR
ncbi:BRO-N domain-containing protein [Pseudomonas sp. TE3610]